ncbi:MAG: thymidine kinase [Bacteriovoracia bacterium]
MFSGKTEELIRLVKRLQIARQKVQIFKPGIDDRYDVNDVVSHSSQVVQSEPVNSAIEILLKLKDSTRIVAIDEVQFFDHNVIQVVKKLARRGFRVICAGLDLDYRAEPFGPMPMLLAVADEVKKLSAICTICGAPARRSQRIIEAKDQVLVGETEAYEARCRAHYDCEGEDETLMPLREEIQTEFFAEQ